MENTQEKYNQIFSFEAYFERFFELKFDAPYSTDLGVWLDLEAEYKTAYGTSKYSSFESFRVGKYRYCKKLQTKK